MFTEHFRSNHPHPRPNKKPSCEVWTIYLVQDCVRSRNYFEDVPGCFLTMGISVVTQISSFLHSYVNLSYSLKSLPTLKLFVISQRTFRIGLLHVGQFISTL
jgi:hypothetical protein